MSGAAGEDPTPPSLPPPVTQPTPQRSITITTTPGRILVEGANNCSLLINSVQLVAFAALLLGGYYIYVVLSIPKGLPIPKNVTWTQ